MRNHTVSDAVEQLIRSVTSLVESVGSAAADARAPQTEVRARRAPGRQPKEAETNGVSKSNKLRKSLKSYWANLSPKARKARVAAILRGRGLIKS